MNERPAAGPARARGVRGRMQRMPLWAWTFGASLLLHLIVLLAPGWHLPARPTAVTLEATLRLPPARRATVEPVAAPAPKAPPSRTEKPVGRPPERLVRTLPAAQAEAPAVHTAPLPNDLPEPGLAASAPVAPGPEVPPVAASSDPAPPVSVDPQATQGWPREGRVSFQVRYGEALEVGALDLTWSHDGERYTLRAEARTVGLARIIKRYNAVQQSQGFVGPEGLAPTGFQEDLNGKQSHAVFDWAARKVTLSRPDRTRTESFSGLAQDVLSLVHHLAFQPDDMAALRVLVVAGRWAAEAELTQVANEVLRLPWGSVLTRHFHCEARNGEYAIDVWLARDHRNAPIRVRVDDRKQGHVVDQIAQEIELDGVKVEFRLTPEQQDLYKG